MRASLALLLYVVAFSSHGLIHCSTAPKTHVGKKIDGNFAPLCTYCELIYGPNSPYCFLFCVGPLPFSAPSSSSVDNIGVTASHVWCELCKNVYGENSPKCDAICHRNTPNHPESGLIIGVFPHQCAHPCYGPTTNTLLPFPALPPFVSNNVECAFCQFVYGYNSPLCVGVCIRFGFGNSVYLPKKMGETTSYPMNSSKRITVY